MKRSARIAYIFILLFFLSFNGLQVFLIIERINEAKNRFGFTCSGALLNALSEYNKLKAIDSTSLPAQGWIVYADKKIGMSRTDSQSVNLGTPLSSVTADTLEPVFIEMILNSRVFRSIDMKIFDALFKKGLRSKRISAAYRLDTIVVPGKRFDRYYMQNRWLLKKEREYPNAIPPARLSSYSNIAIFAMFKNDPAFIKDDLLWPMVAFAFILLIGNTALVFVYRTIRKQKRINEVKTDFINNMTHEMKTPITIASAGLDALEHHVTSTERTDFYLDTSKKQLYLLNDFIERILDAAVRDIPDLMLKKERIVLRPLFDELVQTHSVLQEKPVSFRLTGEEDAYINGDRLHLEAAFRNIIDNAVKYSNGPVQIDIDIAANSRDCIIKIRDNGMGIPPQYIKNIFEKFFRVPKGDAQAIKGFGLGLYYVSNVVKKHSGNISVHSKQGAGTEFIITLPKHL